MHDSADDWSGRLQAEIRQLIERYGFYEFEEVSGEIVALESERLKAEKDALLAARADALKPFLHDIDRIMGPSPHEREREKRGRGNSWPSLGYPEA